MADEPLTPVYISGVIATVLRIERQPAFISNAYVTYIARDIGEPTLMSSGEYELLQAVNRRNGTKLTFGEVTFGEPTPNGQEGYNTTVRITPTVTSGLSGFVDIAYRRVSITSVLPQSALNSIDVTEGMSAHDILPELNSLLGIRLGERDILNDPLTLGKPIVLTAAPGSYYFDPNFIPAVPLTTHLPVQDLSGFTIPTVTLDTLITQRELSGFDQSLTRAITVRDLSGFVKTPPPIDLKTLFGQ